MNVWTLDSENLDLGEFMCAVPKPVGLETYISLGTRANIINVT